MKRRVLAMILTLIMVFTSVDITAFAESDGVALTSESTTDEGTVSDSPSPVMISEPAEEESALPEETEIPEEAETPEAEESIEPSLTPEINDTEETPNPVETPSVTPAKPSNPRLRFMKAPHC